MNAIVTQNDIKSIVDSIVASTNATSKIIEASVKSINGIITKYKLDANIKGINNIVKFSEIYSNSIEKIINTICVVKDNKNLSQLLGRIEEYDNNKKTKVEKFTVVDAALQLPTVFNSIFGIFEKLSNFKGGFVSLIKFRINMYSIKSMLSELITEFIDMFNDISSSDNIQQILDTLIKQPDTIKELTKTAGGKTEGTTKIDPTTIVTKETKTGQLGLLDIFEKTFSLIGLLNNLTVPNLTGIKIKFLKIRLTLSIILSDLTKWFKKNVNGISLKVIEGINDFLIGKKNEKGIREGGLDSIVSSLQQIVLTLKYTKISIKSFICIFLSLKMLGIIINTIKKLYNNIEIISDSSFIEKVDNAKSVFDKFNDIFKSLLIMSGYALLLGGGLMLLAPTLVFLSLIPFIDLIKWTMTKCAELDENGFSTILDVINSLKDIMVKLAFMTLLSIAGIAGIISAIIFAVGLNLFVLAIWGISALISKIANFAVENLEKVNKLIFSLMLIGAAILLFAAIAPVVEKAIQENLTSFIVVLFGSLVLLAGMLFAAKLLSNVASEAATGLVVNILIIAGCFILAAMTILVAGLVGQQMKEGDSIINILIGLAGIIVVSGVMIGLGIALSFAAPFIGMAAIGITPLVAVLALMLSAGLTLVALGNIKLEFGQYTATDEDDESKTYGIKGNIGKIINLTKFLKEQFNEVKENKRVIKQGKRLLRQVKKTVRLIKRIAKDLNFIQKIELNEGIINSKVDSIFKCIDGLEKNINKMLYGEKSDNIAVKTISTITDFGITGFIKRSAERKKANKTNKKLNRVEKVVNTLTDIGQAMTSIQEFKLTSELRTEIESNVSQLFLFISSLDGEIAKFMVKTETNEDGNIVDTEKMSKREWKQANNKLSKVEKVIATIQSIGDALNTIKELGFGKDKDKAGNDKVKTAIIANVTGSLESIDEIAKVINGKSDTINIDETKLNNATKIIDYIQSLNNGFKGISETDPNKIKTNLDNYVKFVEKVNTIDVSKVETTANLFKQMSKFSNSIKGDFDRLAESLSDKLLPVLTELKEIMSEVPGKLDIGFQNTSASIAATNAAPTKENVAAQVSRENPNLSRSDVDAIVAARLNERARTEANGMSAKLDELISLLKGMSGENVIVKTV